MLFLADAIGEASFWIIASCLVVIALSVFGFLIGAWARRRILDQDSPHDAGFGLGDLRRLLTEGKITEAEFEKARDKIVDAAKKRADSIPTSGAKPPRGNS